MEKGFVLPGKALTWLDSSLNAVRQLLKVACIGRSVRGLRAAVHFGPWRHWARALIRAFRPIRKTDQVDEPSLLEGLDVDNVVKALQKNSVCMAGVLPETLLKRLRAVTDKLPRDQYQWLHRIDENVKEISEDPGVLKVLRTYFGCEPVLLESTLMITGPDEYRYLGNQNVFHVDYAGWQSLNVFVYLSDVQEGASYHQVAQGSHRRVSLRDALRGEITNEEAEARFGSDIKTIIGPAGTIFFENTEAFHRRYPGQGMRVMLNLLFASHRGWLSHGRVSESELAKCSQAYHRYSQTTV